MDYAEYPMPVVEDIARLRRRIDASGIPGKLTDHNLVIGSWNIRAFSRVYPAWTENPGSPKRNLRAMASIAEIARRFDVLAIQEVKRDTEALRMLVEGFLGPDWALIVSDVTAGYAGNQERLAFVYDTRRVTPSGLVGEIVLPPTPAGATVEQFDRTPYLVGFRAGRERFTLLTAHIRYGDAPEAREPELAAFAQHIAKEIRDRATPEGEENNLIVLGDFNIDKRGDNPLFQAFVATGLMVPEALRDLKTTYGTEAKYYDQIAWFMGELDLLTTERAGVIDSTDAVFPELTLRAMSYRVSDHLPVWVEFLVDRSTEQMAQTLGVDPAAPDPLSVVT
ncbi:MAG: endonuclease/exonuclease/phosphatase family protein [Anaerolineae bacterium]